MNPLIKELGDLRTQLSVLNFVDYPTSRDKKEISNLEDQIKKISKELAGYKGVAVRFSYKGNGYGKDYFYLTTDDTLCFSESPAIFENRQEASEYLNKAKIDNLNQYNIEFIDTYYGEKRPRYQGDAADKETPKVKNKQHGKWSLSDDTDQFAINQLFQCPFCKALVNTPQEECPGCGAILDID